jgi:small subunit ribosomal protein S19e
MATIHDVDANELIEKVAEELKKNESIKPPEWSDFVKTGRHKERTPLRKDWWYIRAAAVLRTTYRNSPIGVAKLRVKYGGKKRRGHKPSKFYIGSGNIIRKILQQLEKAGFLKQIEKAQHKGRTITPQGKSFLDKLANEIFKNSNPVKKQEELIKKESKILKEEKKLEKPSKVEQAPIEKEVKEAVKEEKEKVLEKKRIDVERKLSKPKGAEKEIKKTEDTEKKISEQKGTENKIVEEKK